MGCEKVGGVGVFLGDGVDKRRIMKGWDISGGRGLGKGKGFFEREDLMIA